MPGEQYRLVSKAKCASAEAAGKGANLWVRFKDANGAQVGGYLQTAPVVNGAAWADTTLAFAVPATAAWMDVEMVSMQTAAGNFCYFDNLFLRRAADANLIVDGTITAAKLNVADVQAAVVTAAAINAAPSTP